MKRKFLAFGLSFVISLAAMAETQVCSTQTRNVTDDEGNTIYSATCTKCDNNATVARIKAGTCAMGGLKVMMAADEVE